MCCECLPGAGCTVDKINMTSPLGGLGVLTVSVLSQFHAGRPLPSALLQSGCPNGGGLPSPHLSDEETEDHGHGG